MATRPKAVIESSNGEGLSPITIAKNVLTDDGQNLHDILSNRKEEEEEEEDMMTPAIENSSSMFKVGQGDDVDYSTNVVNGAYESMVLKGKSMVNCIQEPSSQDVVLPYEFEDGQYITINDTKESGALGVELKGQTKYRDIDTSEILETFEEGRNLELITVRMPILHTVGKNLFDGKFKLGEIAGGVESNETKYVKSINYIPVKPNTNYFLSCTDGYNSTDGRVIAWYDSNKKFITHVNHQGISPINACYARIRTRKDDTSPMTESEVSTIQAQLEEATSATSYEAYKTSILSLPEEVVLRSLPNGVCDTFNTRTGVYTQRIGETVLNGSEDDWVSIRAFSKTNVFRKPFSLAKNEVTDYETTVANFMTDKLPVVKYRTYDVTNAQTISFSSLFNSTYNDTAIYINKNSSSNLSEFKTWLSQNPVTVQYELKTPIVTKINLSSTLKSWNTTTHIYSEIPENTLYPILTHSNPTYPVILKPGTKYSIVANSYSNGHTNSTINFNLGGATASTTVGNRVTTITTPSTLTSEELVMSGRGNKLNNLMVIEGDVVGDEPYFEGICDCKSPILSNIGKNLFDANEFKRVFGSNVEVGLDGTIVSLGDIKGGNHNLSFHSPINIALKPNTKYTLCLFNLNTSGQIIRVEGCLSTCNSELSMSNVAINSVGYKVFTTNSQNYKDGVSFKVMTGATTGEKAQYQIMIVEGEVSHETYSPYKSNTTTFDQKDGKMIVLRSLPNGVCDTLNVETGEHVQRIGEVTFDGSNDEKWQMLTASNNWTDGMKNILTFICPKPSNCALIWAKEGNEFAYLSNKFPSVPSVDKYAKEDKEKLIFDQGDIKMATLKSKLNTQDLVGFKAWLQSNPVTVQYELATPIVSIIDVQGFPHAYTNGHVQLSSEHSGQSLTPKVEYSVATNRNGQIRSNQKMVERHQKQLDRLQAMILTNLVNTQYEQTLTNLKYDLKNVREEVK